jgi:GNAT superfamily N-acetyltransferase
VSSGRFVDLAFAKRLEMVSAVSGRECAQALHVFAPHVLTDAEEIAGGIAVFTGVDSPVTQAFGFGLDGPVSAAELDRLETFFFSHGAQVTLELCPFIDRTLVELLRARPYRLEEFSNVLVRDITDTEAFGPAASAVTVRTAKPGEAKLYTKVVTDGFAEQVPPTQSLLEVVEGFYHRPRGQCFFALVDGEIAGAAAVAAQDEIGEFYGASTLPGFRNRGVQAALIAERMVWAAQHGCKIATTTTGPATTSQRNFERAGFRIVYSRTKLVRNREINEKESE